MLQRPPEFPHTPENSGKWPFHGKSGKSQAIYEPPQGNFENCKILGNSQGMAMADFNAGSEHVAQFFIYLLIVSRQNHWKNKPFTNSPKVNMCNIYLPMVNWWMTCIYPKNGVHFHGKSAGQGNRSFLRKRGRYFKKNCTYLVSSCLHEQIGDTIMDGWPQFEGNFNVFADMILPYGSYCIDMTPSPEPINGATGTWVSCFATCD